MNVDTLRQGRQLHLKILSHLHQTYSSVFVSACILTSTSTVLHQGVEGIEQCHSSLKIKNLDENCSDDPKYMSFRIN